MKKGLLLLGLFFCFYSPKVFSQDFLGLSTGNYSGITGVMLQPASIVDSRFKFDINLLSTDVNYSNNYFLLDRKAILKINKNNFDNYATFKDNYLSEASLPAGQKVFFNINNRTQLPGFMATTGKKSAIALNLQFRTMIQGRGITQDFANLAFNNFYPSGINPSIDASGISINSLSWAEVGFTYGRVLYSSGAGFLKAAITAKYLAGLSSISLSSNDLRMRVNGDSTFNFTSSNVSYNHNKNADFNTLFDKNFSPNANSFGIDAGLVYEYRGNLDKFKYIKSNDETSYDALRRDVSKYIFKVGVSLLDVGMFKFDKPADVNSFSANINNWDIKNAHYNSIKEFDTALASRVIANPNDPRSYNVYLPTALSGQLDVKFVKGLFLNVMSYWPLDLGNTAGKRFTKYGFYTITPRYETRHFGIYIPYTVSQRNDFTDYNQHLLGATLRLGPVFIGSSNLLSMAFNKNLRAADVHIGFKVGFTYGKPNKSNKFLNTVFKKNQKVEPNSSMESGSMNYESETIDKANQNDHPRLILDYKEGKIYDNPNAKQNVIIINNYYGNKPVQTTVDTVTMQNRLLKYYVDSLNAQTLQTGYEQNKKIADSISKVTTDSLKMKRTQLDSLIRSMQRLQMQMDSSNNETNNSFNNGRSSNNYSAIENPTSANDSLRNVNDSLEKRPAAIAGMHTNQKDTATTAYLNNHNTASSTSKKKDTSTRDNNVTLNKTDTTLAANDANKTVVANIEKTYQDSVMQDLQRIKQQQNELSDKNAAQADSNSKAKIAEQNNNKKAALAADEDYRTAAARMQTVQTQGNSKELQRVREQQNELYRQYADQSARLSNDINRLSRRQDESRQRTRVNYVPVGIPYNNSRSRNKQEPPQVATSTVANLTRPNKTDTVYLRDTITVIPAADTVTHIVSKEARPDTVIVKESVKQPAFNYTRMPVDNILFATGQSVVQPIYGSRLDFIADVLKENPGLQVTVTGHTDATGSKTINEKLSLLRAEAVSYYLLNKGVSKKQITVKSLSSEKPAVTGSTKTARTQNRRVALKLNNLNE
jgi:outer membrane protein OmpA-like peptidoglycan-associated protein